MKKMTDKAIGKAVAKMVADNTPTSSGKCKARGCRGAVVKKVTGLFRGQYLFTNPACEKCGRMYLYAKNAPQAGVEEFRKSLSRPMTI